LRRIGQAAARPTDRIGAIALDRSILLALLVAEWLPIEVDIFAALSDPVRRSLLAELAGGPRRVVDLAETRPISRPAVSKHLRLLLEAQAVTVEDRGRERYYALAPAALTPVATYVGGLVARPVPEQALDALETEVHRTTRERRRTA
jgi:DNA-binding transcriptional ArsR family regulator